MKETDFSGATSLPFTLVFVFSQTFSFHSDEQFEGYRIACGSSWDAEKSPALHQASTSTVSQVRNHWAVCVDLYEDVTTERNSN